MASMASGLNTDSGISGAGVGVEKRAMELLAPAGSFPAFEAALEAGADAVYVGAPGCNARALSRDFTFAEIGSMIGQAHRQGVRLYIAMNSLVKEDELPRVIEALSCFEELRPDALIIQDLGLLYLARNWFPGLSLHASTLMSVHNSLAARELTRLGFERVVLARELTLAEMAEIHRKTGVEIEVFVHGAMCFSYSGLCLFSSLHGGKSSLRGQCVQPCRRHYSWRHSGKSGRSGEKRGSSSYLFSMNDLCGIDVLPELRAAGVACLKIEGRMKSARYVANTVAAYRMALDSLDASEHEQDRMLREAHRLLDQAMARKRSTGYLLTGQPTEAITPQQSGNSGLLLGRVTGLYQERGRDGKNSLCLQLVLKAPVSQGDRLRLHDERSGERTGFTLHLLQVNKQRKKTAGPGQTVEIFFTAELQGKMGDRKFHGSLFKVDVGSRIIGERSGRRRSRKLSARRIVPDRRKVEQVLDRINWKKGVAGRERPDRERNRKKCRSAGRRSQRQEPAWWLGLARIADLRQRLPVHPARIVVPLNRDNMRDLAAAKNKIKKFHGRIIWRLPPVLHEADLDWYGRQVAQLVGSGYRSFELGHCSQYGLFTALQGDRRGLKPELYGQYTLNIMNSAALHAARALGFQGVLLSLESEGSTVAAAVAHFKWQAGRKRAKRPSRIRVGLYVYGRPPLFTARLDAEHFRYGQQFVSPQREAFTLEKRDGLTLARSTLPFSLLRWQEEISALKVDYLFLDLSGGPIRQEIATAGALLGGGKRRLPVLSGNFHGTLR